MKRTQLGPAALSQLPEEKLTRVELVAYRLAREDAKARLKLQGIKPNQATMNTLNHVTFQLYRIQREFYLRRAKKQLKKENKRLK